MRALAAGMLVALAACGEVEMTAEQKAERDGFRLCGAEVRSRLNNPSSLEWDRSAVTYFHDDEGVWIGRPFTAENAFGGKVRNVANCHYDPGQERLVSISID